MCLTAIIWEEEEVVVVVVEGRMDGERKHTTVVL